MDVAEVEGTVVGAGAAPAPAFFATGTPPADLAFVAVNPEGEPLPPGHQEAAQLQFAAQYSAAHTAEESEGHVDSEATMDTQDRVDSDHDSASEGHPGSDEGTIYIKVALLDDRYLPLFDDSGHQPVFEEGVGLWVAVLMPAGGTVQNLVDELCTGQVRLCRVSPDCAFTLTCTCICSRNRSEILSVSTSMMKGTACKGRSRLPAFPDHSRRGLHHARCFCCTPHYLRQYTHIHIHIECRAYLKMSRFHALLVYPFNLQYI
jgi:hypothetical protein